MNDFVFTLLEAEVSLYPVDGTGAPVLEAPVWLGTAAENLTIRSRWIKNETRPTGARTPKKHALVEQYEITLGRVWSLLNQGSGRVASAQFEARQYVLDVVWRDEDSGNWHRRTFYGVTISHQDLSSRNVDEGFTEEQGFDAESMMSDGGEGTPTAMTRALPALVNYTGPYGSEAVYRYDAGTGIYTAIATGLPAEIVYMPGDRSGTLAITFGVERALAIGLDGVVTVSALVEGAPSAGNFPRLDFYYGPVRVASLTAAGELFAAGFTAGSPSGGAGKLELWANGALAMTMEGSGVTAVDFVEP